MLRLVEELHGEALKMSMNEHVKGLVDSTRAIVRNAQLTPGERDYHLRKLERAENLAKNGICGLAVAQVQGVLARVSVLSPSLYDGPLQ